MAASQHRTSGPVLFVGAGCDGAFLVTEPGRLGYKRRVVIRL